MTALFADTFYRVALADFTGSDLLERDFGPVSAGSCAGCAFPVKVA
jgi:hypothetical protein